jgi:L-fuculose-phosphate aldolase
MADEARLREEIVEAGKRLYKKGFVAANDGNVSARLDGGRILITPSGVCKGDMDPGMLVVVDGDGKVLSGRLKPSSEMKMHLAVYRIRDDVKAIVHAHPPKATAFAVAGLPLDKLTLPEVVFSLGSVAFSEYGTPSTKQVPEAVVRVIGDAGAVLLANHGALTVGAGVMDAYFRMETLEHFAAITLYARLLGGERELSPKEESELIRIRREVFGKTDG